MNPVPYIPLDIPLCLPNEDDIYNFCISNSYSNSYNFERGIIVTICSKCPADDWRSSTDFYGGLIHDFENKSLAKIHEKEWWNRVNNSEGLGNLYFHPDFEKKFPNLLDSFKLLPFKYIVHAVVMLVGKLESPIHRDPPVLQLCPEFKNLDIEFNRFNIQLNCFDNSPMFWTDGISKYYLKMSKDYPCYAFNNKDFLHGADAPNEFNKKRMQILIYGIIDPVKYEELISRSKKKFTKK